MVVINVSLVSAITGKTKSLGSMKIVNDGKGNDRFRNYNYEISKFGEKGIWKVGYISNLDTLHRGPWDLLYMILKQTIGKRND